MLGISDVVCGTFGGGSSINFARLGHDFIVKPIFIGSIKRKCDRPAVHFDL